MSDQRGSDGCDDPLQLAPGEWGSRTTLRDGTPVLLRQIRPEDRDRLAEGLRQLSPASRFLRFHADIDTLTDAQLRYLTCVDHIDHEAIVAVDLDRPEVPGVGVARYVRDPFEREVAEAVVTVADEYHGRGAGTLLLGALSARARENGVRVFRNYVLERNVAMLDVFDQLGASRELESGGIWRVDLALPESARDLPDSPAGRAFLAVAKGGFRPSTLLPPVWSRSPRGSRAKADASDLIDAEELAALQEELSSWLEDREQRTGGWPKEADEEA